MGMLMSSYSSAEEYTCTRCGAYGDQCACGPEQFGCSGEEGCLGSWHTHGCFADNGDCDRPEEHVIAAGYPIPPTPTDWKM